MSWRLRFHPHQGRQKTLAPLQLPHPNQQKCSGSLIGICTALDISPSSFLPCERGNNAQAARNGARWLSRCVWASPTYLVATGFGFPPDLRQDGRDHALRFTAAPNRKECMVNLLSPNAATGIIAVRAILSGGNVSLPSACRISPPSLICGKSVSGIFTSPTRRTARYIL